MNYIDNPTSCKKGFYSITCFALNGIFFMKKLYCKANIHSFLAETKSEVAILTSKWSFEQSMLYRLRFTCDEICLWSYKDAMLHIYSYNGISLRNWNKMNNFSVLFSLMFIFGRHWHNWTIYLQIMKFKTWHFEIKLDFWPCKLILKLYTWLYMNFVFKSLVLISN